MDGEGRTIVWNPAAEVTFGYTRDEMIGRPLLEAIWQTTLAVFRAEQMRYQEENGKAWPLNERVELTARRSDGTEFPVELSVTDARLDDGSPIFTAYIRDISERKAAEALLARRADQQAAVAALGQRALTGGALDGLMQDAVATVARTLAVERVALLERT